MGQWFDTVVLADSASLSAGTPLQAGISRLRSPTMCVALEDLEGAADDTATIRVVGAAGTYEVDSRTNSAAGSYFVDLPQAQQVEFESLNGVTYSVEVRGNP